MIGEEAIKMLEYIKRTGNGESAYKNDAQAIAIDMGIEAIKQGDVIEKIRAQINDWQTDIHDNEHDAKTYDFVFERIYEIIDECKAECGGKT